MIQNEKNIIFILTDSNITLNLWVHMLKTITSSNMSLKMESFNILSVLGRGYYGKVMLVEHKESKEIFALKTIRKSLLVNENKVENVILERNILLSIDHPFIVSLKFAFQSESKLYLGLEYIAGGELFHLLQNGITLKPKQIQFYVAEVALALNYLHSLGILYRDLKLENVLICDDGHIKLTDFGLSKWLINQKTSTFCGTNEYLAPEIILGQQYSFEIDWWALGIFTYECNYGKTPFHDNSPKKIFQNIINKEPKFTKNNKDLIDFIKLLLEKNPKKRSKFEEIKKSNFFKNLNWNDIYLKKLLPPFIPKKITGRKATNFNINFKKEIKKDSDATITNHICFDGFSYIGDLS